MTQTIQLTVTGMTCGGCENAVKRTLTQLSGVQSVNASHQLNHVDVTYDGDKVTPAQLKAGIEALGYSVAA